MRIVPRNRIPRSRQIYWSTIFVLLMVSGLFGLGAFVFSPSWLNTAGMLPIALHSPLRADYSANLRGMRPLALGLGLVGEAARDQAASSSTAGEDLANQLLTPVPTATTLPTLANTQAATAFPTQTPYNPTSTAGPGATQPPQASPSASPTATAVPTRTAIVLTSPTPTPTRTPGGPNPTSGNQQPTQTNLPPTATSQPPTATNPPPTLPPAPTNTPRPPTNTPRPPTSYPAPPTQSPGPTSNPYP